MNCNRKNKEEQEDEGQRMFRRISEYVNTMTAEELEKAFEDMGGKELVTPFGTLRYIDRTLTGGSDDREED